MKTHDLRFRISQLQQAQQNALLTAILVTVFAVVTTAVAPQLLYEYFLQNAELEQQLIVLRYLPAVSYGVALLTFVVALVKNFLRSRSISMYEQELQLLAYTFGDDCMHCGEGVCVCVDDSATEEKKAPAKKSSTSKKSSSTKSTKSKKSSSSKKKSTSKKSK